MKKLTHLSLCTGIGGIDLAAEMAGFETVAQCEIDPYASKVLRKNFEGVINLNDMRTVTNARLRGLGIPTGAELTVLSAGFPCQPYSLAGKGLGDSDERDLWGEVGRIVGEIRPKWFVGENTPGLFSRANQRYFGRVVNDLSEMGYSVGWGMWGASDIGAPHKRNRVFIVARNTDLHGYKTERKVSQRENADTDGVRGELPDTAFERCCEGEIQRGKLEEGRREKSKWRIQEGRDESFGVCGSFSNAFGFGLEKQGSEITAEKIGDVGSDNGSGVQTEATGHWWKTEPDVGRVAHGIFARVDRLRCLGNAVVPAQIYPLFEAIAKTENEE